MYLCYAGLYCGTCHCRNRRSQRRSFDPVLIGRILGRICKACPCITLQEKNKNYMTALKAGGCGHARIIFRHVLRNILPSVIALATMEIGSIILSIAGFSFIGLGVQAPTPEWGIMLSDSKSYIQTYPRLMFYPGILIMIIVLAFNYLGEGIQNGTDKK